MSQVFLIDCGSRRQCTNIIWLYQMLRWHINYIKKVNGVSKRNYLLKFNYRIENECEFTWSSALLSKRTTLVQILLKKCEKHLFNFDQIL